MANLLHWKSSMKYLVVYLLLTILLIDDASSQNTSLNNKYKTSYEIEKDSLIAFAGIKIQDINEEREIYKKFNSLGISPKEDAIEILERYKLKVCYRQYGKVLKPWAKLLNIFGWISNERK